MQLGTPMVVVFSSSPGQARSPTELLTRPRSEADWSKWNFLGLMKTQCVVLHHVTC